MTTPCEKQLLPKSVFPHLVSKDVTVYVQHLSHQSNTANALAGFVDAVHIHNHVCLTIKRPFRRAQVLCVFIDLSMCSKLRNLCVLYMRVAVVGVCVRACP